MKMFGLALLVSAAGIGTALHAQTAATSSSANKVTVTGCVQRAASDGPTGTSGTAGAAKPDTQFILANASAGTSTAGTSGTAGSSAATVAPRYQLDDDAASKITPHVNHKVEVIGTIDEPKASAGSMSAPKLKVDSIRMIASTCSE